MTSLAPDTGRTAEEMRAVLADVVVDTLIEWQAVTAGTTQASRVADALADALLSGPLAPILQEAATLRARLQEAERDREAWKRVAVIAAIPLEAMRMAGSYRALAPSTQTCVDEAVVTIRMAVTGHSLPPEGDLDAGLAPARAALATPVPQTQEAGDGR